jgi:hypothetical protein
MPKDAKKTVLLTEDEARLLIDISEQKIYNVENIVSEFSLENGIIYNSTEQGVKHKNLKSALKALENRY